MAQAKRLAEINKRQAEYFVALYEEGNVTRAAAKLHIVQPALSMQIRRLEHEFSVKLFERTARGVQPTTVGRAFYQKCQKILTDFQAARLYLAEAAATIAGDVVVGVMPTVAMVLPHMLPTFMETYPQVRLHIVEAYSSNLALALRERKVDAAIMNRIDEPVLATRAILHDELVLLTGANSKIADGPYAARELRRLKLVLPSREQGIRALVDQALGKTGINIEPHLEFDSVHGIIDVVKRSRWATILPHIAYLAPDDDSLRAHLIAEPVIPREIVAAHHVRRSPSAATLAFVAAVEVLLTSLHSGRRLDTRKKSAKRAMP